MAGMIVPDVKCIETRYGHEVTVKISGNKKLELIDVDLPMLVNPKTGRLSLHLSSLYVSNDAYVEPSVKSIQHAFRNFKKKKSKRSMSKLWKKAVQKAKRNAASGFSATLSNGLTLEQQLLQRIEPGADVEAIDAQIIKDLAVSTCIVIVYGHHEEPESPVDALASVLLMKHAINPLSKKFSGTLVKWMNTRGFFRFDSAWKALQFSLCVSVTGNYLHTAFPGYGLRMSAGIDYGKNTLILERPNDFYGDSVNIASKLGEDYASADDVYMSDKAFKAINGDFVALCERSVNFEHETVRISGVTIECRKCTIRRGSKLAQIVDSFCKRWSSPAFLTSELLKQPQEKSGGEDEEDDSLENVVLQIVIHNQDPAARKKLMDRILPLSRNMVVVNTDMSGFSRLTQKYGISHFLTLVLVQRRIWLRLEEKGCTIIKYEGDNVIAKFKSPADGIWCCIEAFRQFDEFNKDKPKDFQVRVGCALGKIKCIKVGLDILGDDWEVIDEAGEEMSETGEILVNQSMFDFMTTSGDDRLVQLAEKATKDSCELEDNVSEPVYRVIPGQTYD